MVVTKKQDEDLNLLLTKLYAIQEQVGAKDKTTDEEKRLRAENSGKSASMSMGKGKRGKKAGSRFLELKSSIVTSLKAVHGLIEEQANSKRTNPKEAIAAQAEIREYVRKAGEEWEELNELYKKEARKNKSKFTKEELEVQQTLVMQLQAEIEKVKEAQLAGYAKGGKMEEKVQLNLSALAALDAADFYSNDNGEFFSRRRRRRHPPSPSFFIRSPPFIVRRPPRYLRGGGGLSSSWTPGPSGTALSGSQFTQLQLIRDRDQEFDKDLDEIGEGIQDLHELALRQGEEVRRQNAMLENTSNRIESAHEHMTNVNSKMKDTLAEVGRSTDKLCVDIMCIVFGRTKELYSLWHKWR
ncbi:hypothetical protein ACHAW5_001948 [Stephanodiscus triporus]|uniref:t-SNARE coiled-coil homology domain-containing protein n=1 Tax=Stephanodiscus triporus TaxID=2934178 RepID=A0ABD3MZA0_9STRA